MHCTDCTPRPAQVLSKDKERDCCYLQPEQEASVATLTNDSNDTVISHYVEFCASSKNMLGSVKILTPDQVSNLMVHAQLLASTDASQVALLSRRIKQSTKSHGTGRL